MVECENLGWFLIVFPALFVHDAYSIWNYALKGTAGSFHTCISTCKLLYVHVHACQDKGAKGMSHTDAQVFAGTDMAMDHLSPKSTGFSSFFSE